MGRMGAERTGCSDVICCELLERLINHTEALPKWKPGLAGCFFLPLSCDQLFSRSVAHSGTVSAAEEVRAMLPPRGQKCRLISPGGRSQPDGVLGAGGAGSVLRGGSGRAAVLAPGCCGQGGIWRMAAGPAPREATLKISITCPFGRCPQTGAGGAVPPGSSP